MTKTLLAFAARPVTVLTGLSRSEARMVGVEQKLQAGHEPNSRPGADMLQVNT